MLTKDLLGELIPSILLCATYSRKEPCILFFIIYFAPLVPMFIIGAAIMLSPKVTKELKHHSTLALTLSSKEYYFVCGSKAYKGLPAMWSG